MSICTMKIKSLVSARLAHGSHNSNREVALRKGGVYEAFHATSEVNWKERGKVFAFKKGWPYGTEILLKKGEYVLV